MLSIKDSEKDNLLRSLATANRAFQVNYPGDRPDRQPVHTVYGGANLFKHDTCVRMGGIALKSLRTYAPNFVELARALLLEGHQDLPQTERGVEELDRQLEGMSEEQRRKEKAWLPWSVYNKVIRKLETEPVEDFRIDFEDGYGNRPDAEEDAVAISSAGEVAMGMKNETLSPFIGI